MTSEKEKPEDQNILEIWMEIKNETKKNISDKYKTKMIITVCCCEYLRKLTHHKPWFNGKAASSEKLRG